MVARLYELDQMETGQLGAKVMHLLPADRYKIENCLEQMRMQQHESPVFIHMTMLASLLKKDVKCQAINLSLISYPSFPVNIEIVHS